MNSEQSAKQKDGKQKPQSSLAKQVDHDIQGGGNQQPLYDEAMRRAQESPASLSPAEAMRLQRTVGNRAAGALVRGSVSAEPSTTTAQRSMAAIVQRINQLGVQAKLTVGPVDDPHEVEADQVAAQVVQTLNAPAQRQEEDELEMKRIDHVQRQEEDELEMKRIDRIQREEDEELELTRLQRASETEGDPMLDGGDVSSEMESNIRDAKGDGQQLNDAVRKPMEEAFNADFSGVRVHADARSDSLNRSVSARAFTTGSDIFFRSGEFDTGSTSGQQLLAHELTHVVQQNGAPVQRDSRQEASIVGNASVSNDRFAATMQRAVMQQNAMKQPSKKARGNNSRWTQIYDAVGNYHKINDAEDSTAENAYIKLFALDQVQEKIDLFLREYKFKKKGKRKQALQLQMQVRDEIRTLKLLQGVQDNGVGGGQNLFANGNWNGIKGSKGGIGGVFFLHENAMDPNQNEEDQNPGRQIVVKFEKGASARALLAEDFLAQMGLPTTTSAAFKKTSNEGAAIEQRVRQLITANRMPGWQARLNDIRDNTIDAANTVIVSNYVQAMEGSVQALIGTWGDNDTALAAAGQQQLLNAFQNLENLANIGSMVVADSFLGNEDRINPNAKVNLANIMLSKIGDNWMFVLIDNDSDVPSMMGQLEVLKMDAVEPINSIKVGDWVKKLTEGGWGMEKMTAKLSYIAQDSITLGQKMATILKENVFEHSDHDIRPYMQGIFAQVDWSRVAMAVAAGIEKTKRQIFRITDLKLSQMVGSAASGGEIDEQLSIRGLKLKRDYIAAIYEGKTHEAAQQIVLNKALQWYPDGQWTEPQNNK